MNVNGGRLTIVRLCAGSVLRRGLGALVVGVALGWLALPPPLPGAGADAMQARWTMLHVPALLLAAAALATAPQAWPLLCRARPGDDLLQHVVRGPLQGCGLAAAGTLAALAMLLTVAAAAFAAVVGAAPVHAHVAFAGGGAELPVLAGAARSLVLTTASGGGLAEAAPLARIALRPILYLGAGGFEAVDVRVLVAGEPLPPGWQAVRGSHEEIGFDAGGRRVGAITIERGAGSAALALPAGTVEGVVAGTRSGIVNACLAALLYVLPVALALALLCALRRLLASGAAVVVTFAVVLLATVTAVTPNAAALAAHARGRWIPSEPLLQEALPAVATIAALLLLGAWRREQRV